jgi:hypothetical protein
MDSVCVPVCVCVCVCNFTVFNRRKKKAVQDMGYEAYENLQ